MLTRRTRLRLALATLLTGVLASSGLMVASGPNALAAPPNCENTPDSTECGIGGGIEIPGGGGGGGNPGGGGGSGTCTWKGKQVACYIEGAGSFNANDGCYYKVAAPQPSNVPEGMTHYFRSCIDNGGAQVPVDLADPPDLFVPDPAAIAAEIATRIVFYPPEIKLAPANGGVLGLPVWMWIGNAGANDPRQGWGTVTRTETVTGLTVSVTAESTHAVWVMDDDRTSVTCTHQGTPWDSSKGKSPSTTCGYPMAGGDLAGYQKPGTYPISVTTSWDVTWVAGAESGVLPGVTTEPSTLDYVVNELQVVNR